MTLSILSQLSQKLDYYDYYLYVTSPPSKVSPRSITPYHCYIPPNLWSRYKFLNIFWHSFSFKAWKVNSLSIQNLQTMSAFTRVYPEKEAKTDWEWLDLMIGATQPYFAAIELHVGLWTLGRLCKGGNFTC